MIPDIDCANVSGHKAALYRAAKHSGNRAAKHSGNTAAQHSGKTAAQKTHACGSFFFSIAARRCAAICDTVFGWTWSSL